MRSPEITRDGPECDGSQGGPRPPRLVSGERRNNDKLALAILIDMIDSPDNWTAGLAVMEIEARGCTAPPCKPATDHVAPVEMTRQ